MYLFEKVFQRNDKIFLQLYYFTVGVSLFLSSLLSYYLNTGTFILAEIYTTASILIVIIFWVSTLVKLRDYRYIIGTVQFLKIEFVVLIQTFLIAIFLTAILKITGNYSRGWLVSTIILSFISLILLKVFFDIIYAGLIVSNVIQRNILLVGDASSCRRIIQKFPKKISNSVIKCLVVVEGIEKKEDTHFYGVPKFDLNDDLNYILKHHQIGQIWIVASIRTQSHIENLVDRFLNFPIDCRLISPESKFKFTEGLDSEAGFDFYNISFSPFYGINLLIKNLLDKILSLLFIILLSPLMILAL